jgi:hypothetical protein
MPSLTVAAKLFSVTFTVAIVASMSVGADRRRKGSSVLGEEVP